MLGALCVRSFTCSSVMNMTANLNFPTFVCLSLFVSIKDTLMAVTECHDQTWTTAFQRIIQLFGITQADFGYFFSRPLR